MSIPGIPPDSGVGPQKGPTGEQAAMATTESNQGMQAFAAKFGIFDPEFFAGFVKNLLSMIGTTISEINARQKIANEYNEKVAKGEE